MSHEIEQMFVVGDRKAAWHQLGNRTDTAVNSDQAAELGGLDWDVRKVQNWACNPFLTDANRQAKGLPGKVQETQSFTVYRDSDGAELGTVGPDYTCVQNRDAFRFIDSVLEDIDGGARYDSAGSLKNGKVVWMAVRTPQADYSVMGQDKHQSYLIFATSHDGSLRPTVILSSIRVVCMNTLQMALGEGNIFRFKHTKNVQSKMNAAAHLLKKANLETTKLQETLNKLALRKMTKDTYMAIMDRLFPRPTEENASTAKRENVLLDVMQLYESNDNNAFPDFKGTAYNLLNAVTEYTDHVRGARISNTRRDAGYSVERARAENAVVGSGNSLKNEALEVILEMTDGAPVNRIVSRPIGDRPEVGPGSLLDQIVG